MEGMFNVFPDNESLTLTADPNQNRREVARFSAKDAEALPEYFLALSKIAMFIKNIIEHPAPDPASFRPRTCSGSCAWAAASRASTRNPNIWHNKILTMSVAEFLELCSNRNTSRPPWPSAASSAPSWACTPRARRTCCCTTLWATWTGPSDRGACSGAGPVR